MEIQWTCDYPTSKKDTLLFISLFICLFLLTIYLFLRYCIPAMIFIEINQVGWELEKEHFCNASGKPEVLISV